MVPRRVFGTKRYLLSFFVHILLAIFYFNSQKKSGTIFKRHNIKKGILTVVQGPYHRMDLSSSSSSIPAKTYFFCLMNNSGPTMMTNDNDGNCVWQVFLLSSYFETTTNKPTKITKYNEQNHSPGLCFTQRNRKTLKKKQTRRRNKIGKVFSLSLSLSLIKIVNNGIVVIALLLKHKTVPKHQLLENWDERERERESFLALFSFKVHFWALNSHSHHHCQMFIALLSSLPLSLPQTSFFFYKRPFFHFFSSSVSNSLFLGPS